MNGKYKVGVKFNKELLHSLRNDENSGVELKRSPYHLSLHPVQLNNFSKSLKQVLNESTAKYNRDLDGILLGFEKTELLTKEAYIHDDSCYIHLDIEADFYVFKPEIGKEMKGLVNRKSKDHVGLLVYNALNVSILKPRDDEEWIGSFVELGAEVLFRITYISLTSFMPYIRGEIISILTDVNPLSECKPQKSRKRKMDASTEGTLDSKRKKIDHSVSDEPEHKSKKKKHSKSLIVSEDIDQSAHDLANNNSSKRKTKYHEDNSLLRKSMGYTVFEEDLIHGMGNSEETPVREKKAKKHKSSRKASFSENTMVPSIIERSKRFSSIDSPMIKEVEYDSMTLENGDLSSTLELDGLTEKTRSKVKKSKVKNNSNLDPYVDDNNDTQTKQKVDEGNVKTKKTKGKKLNASERSWTFNIPVMVKQESGSTLEQGEENSTLDHTDVPLKKKSKKHKDKNIEADT
nr:unnamed protein product [Callosobruchus analis]